MIKIEIILYICSSHYIQLNSCIALIWRSYDLLITGRSYTLSLYLSIRSTYEAQEQNSNRLVKRPLIKD